MTVLFSDLGLPEHRAVAVRDLWAQRELGEFVGRFVAEEVPPHGSMMLALTPGSSRNPDLRGFA